MQSRDERCLETQSKLVACSECDLLQHEVALERHDDAYCARCGAVLYRSARIGLDRMIAFIAGSAVLFFVSNLFPIASLEKQGSHTATTLTGTAMSLYSQGRPLVAALILVTIFLVPAFEICAMLYILLPLRWGRILPGTPIIFRMRLAVSSWSMMEVFMLGVLVTLVKLSDLAKIIPGISLWAFAGLIVLFAAINASFSVRDFWTWVNLIRCAERERPDGQPA